MVDLGELHKPALLSSKNCSCGQDLDVFQFVHGKSVDFVARYDLNTVLLHQLGHACLALCKRLLAKLHSPGHGNGREEIDALMRAE